MSWQIFEAAAARYEQWYAAGRGQQADAAERGLLLHLLEPFREARSALEIGCGTGHFAAFLAGQGFRVTGLDRSPAMLAEAAQRLPSVSFVLGDAHQLPLQECSTDLAVFITTLEFVENPAAALAEAARVARQGLIAIVLNRISIGGLSRRWGPQSRGALLSEAHDFTAPELRRCLNRAAGPRADAIQMASTLFPGGWFGSISRIPAGDVIGAAIKLLKAT
jgi:ubiquinone/menaquinone biosynthesis C-methylase UbiE